MERIPTERKLPHIGWNSLSFPNPSPLFRGLDEGAYVYFVHSYCQLHGQAGFLDHLINQGEIVPHPVPGPVQIHHVDPSGAYVYFVHSYCGCAAREEDVLAAARYGPLVTAAVGRDGVYGCQFHPEKPRRPR